MNKFNFTDQKHNSILVIIISLLTISIAVYSHYFAPKESSASGYFFNTDVSITIYDKNNLEAKKLLDNCIQICSKYDSLFSKTIVSSDIYKINHSGLIPVEVSAETIDILKKAITYAQLSNGTVDPSVGALTSIWNIMDEDFTVPDSNIVSTALMHVNYKNIIIDEVNQTVMLSDSNAQLDLGFIAKGYIADKIKEYLIQNNVHSALINLGGNILCVGNKPNGDKFHIGINDPMNSYLDALDIIKISDKSVVSSGPYERQRKIDNQIYHHIISLKNGYPAESDLSQVTIISDYSVDGDALSTICFILGYEKATNFIAANYPDVKAIFVDSNGHIIDSID